MSNVYQLTANSKTHYIHKFYVENWRLPEVINMARTLYNERYKGDSPSLLEGAVAEAALNIHSDKEHIAYVVSVLLSRLGKSESQSSMFTIGDLSPVKPSILKIAARKMFTLSGEKFEDNEWHDYEGELSEHIEAGKLDLPIYASESLNLIISSGCRALWGLLSREQAYDGDEDFSPEIMKRLSEVSEEVKEVLNDPCEYPLMNFLYRKEIEELFHPKLLNAVKMFDSKKESKFNPCVWEYGLRKQSTLPSIGF